MNNQVVNILVIEDEEAHAELVSRAFKKYADRYSLTIVDNLEKAKQHLKNSVPGLVITDLILPDGKGTELLSQNDEIPGFPMIVMTSYGNEENMDLENNNGTTFTIKFNIEA